MDSCVQADLFASVVVLAIISPSCYYSIDLDLAWYPSPPQIALAFKSKCSPRLTLTFSIVWCFNMSRHGSAESSE